MVAEFSAPFFNLDALVSSYLKQSYMKDIEEMKTYTVKQVSEILQVTPMTVYRLVSRGELDAVRIGRNVRISQSELDRLMGGETR